MVMITLSWPSPSLIGLQRLWLTLETVLLLSQNTGDRERKTRQYKIDRKYKTLQVPTSLLSSLKSISTRPILSSLPTSSWSNSAMSMKSSSSSYLVVARRSLWPFVLVKFHQFRSIPSLHLGFNVLLIVLLLCFSFPRVTLRDSIMGLQVVMGNNDEKQERKRNIGFERKDDNLAIRITTCPAIHGKNTSSLAQNIV